MKIAVALLIVLIVFVPLVILILRSRKGGSEQYEEMFISTQTEGSARAANLLPTQGSEDRSDLLRLPDLPTEPSADGNYRPDPKVDWSVSATFPKGTTLEKAVLLGGFDNKWLQKHGRPEIYGKAETNGHWTFVGAGDSPDFYTELAFAWRLIDDSEEDAQTVSATELAAHLEAFRDRLSVLGEPDLKPSTTPETAVQTALGLVELKTNCDRHAVIVLNAPPNFPFDGRKIWDVMMSLGLEWGDMDIFHWTNPSGSGDDSFFSVWTSTPPGYFLPEQIAADRVKTADLVFGFSIPRCAGPSPCSHPWRRRPTTQSNVLVVNFSTATVIRLTLPDNRRRSALLRNASKWQDFSRGSRAHCLSFENSGSFPPAQRCRCDG